MQSALEYINETPKLLSLLYDLNLLPEQMEDKNPLCLIVAQHKENKRLRDALDAKYAEGIAAGRKIEQDKHDRTYWLAKERSEE